MTKTARFSDEQLLLFADGLADEKTRAAIGKALEAGDENLQSRVDDFRETAAFTAETFSQVTPPQMSLADFEDAPAKTSEVIVLHRLFFGLSPRDVMFFVVGLSMALMAALTWINRPGSNGMATSAGFENWHQFVAAYQRLYVPETLDPIHLTDELVQSEIVKVNQLFDLNIDGSTLSAQTDLRFVRMQTLGLDERAIIQIAFQKSDGTPFALCLRKRDENAPDRTNNVTSDTLMGIDVAIWSKGDFDLMLVGNTDQVAFDSMVDYFRQSS